MGASTAIEWTDATWNPWHGCTKVSPGCAHCYMFREKKVYGQDPTAVVRSKTKFRDPLKWAKQIRAGNRPPGMKVFVCSWSDFFHAAADAWRAEAWAIMRDTPEITYQLVTKRIERAAACLPPDWGAGYPNVWLGTSVEDQKRADQRIPLLLQVPAAVHWISAEPLLGPIGLTFMLSDPFQFHPPRPATLPSLDWVVAGGESGPNCRPPRPEWVRSLRDQCVAAGVPFFFKQWGEAVPYFAATASVQGSQVQLAGDFLGWRKVGRKNAGALLDGREWKEFPEGQ